MLVMISTKQADEITQRKFKMVKKKKKKCKTVHQETKFHTVIRYRRSIKDKDEEKPQRWEEIRKAWWSLSQ